MKKVGTAVAKQIRNFSQPKLTMGLDLGDPEIGASQDLHEGRTTT